MTPARRFLLGVLRRLTDARSRDGPSFQNLRYKYVLPHASPVSELPTSSRTTANPGSGKPSVGSGFSQGLEGAGGSTGLDSDG
jgi:hypothetical protein